MVIVKNILSCLMLVVMAVVVTVAGFDFLLKKRVDGELAEMIRTVAPPSEKRFSREDLDGLPGPVRNYLEYAVNDGRRMIRFVHLKHTGRFRSGDHQKWMPLFAEQYFCTGPPGMIWRAKVRSAPLMWVSTRDIYSQGRGGTLMKMMSAFSTAVPEGPELDRSSLIRYLTDAVWFPSALLPGGLVTWEPIDRSSARAVIRDKGLTASAVFHFNDIGQVARIVSNDIFRAEEGRMVRRRWTGDLADYIEFDGVRIPTSSQTYWNLPRGDFQYGDTQITSIEFDFN